jgi:hypothetical protein
MSRRHQGGRGHRSSGPARTTEPARHPDTARDATIVGTPSPADEPRAHLAATAPVAPIVEPSAAAASGVHGDDERASRREDDRPSVPFAVPERSVADAAHPAAPLPPSQPRSNGADPIVAFSQGPVCTAPQLRRFIKSRPYVPMHELRRRFGINGGEDDVTGIDVGSGRVYVGLPSREGSLLGELLRGGDIGYELSLDPRTPVVIGLYPMRPVARS